MTSLVCGMAAPIVTSDAGVFIATTKESLISKIDQLEAARQGLDRHIGALTNMAHPPLVEPGSRMGGKIMFCLRCGQACNRLYFGACPHCKYKKQDNEKQRGGLKE